MSKVTLAVAGSRKTQSIIEACSSDVTRRTLVITFTLAGQREIERRLHQDCGHSRSPEVLGWYGFLLHHWVGPYLTKLFPGRRLKGFNYHGTPAGGRNAAGLRRFIDSEGRAYKCHLSKLAVDVNAASGGAAANRLARIYDKIYVDEVQDLTGCDLDILELMMTAGIEVVMVGDVRQSLYTTNHEDMRYKQYRGFNMHQWFEAMRSKGLLSITHASTTWRSVQAIATFSDTILPKAYSFPATISARPESTADHIGVFTVSRTDLDAYITAFSPTALRYSRVSEGDYEGPVFNFGQVKGSTHQRVIIFPTQPIKKFLKSGTPLPDKSACGLYVAVTRAEYSVAFIVDKPSNYSLPTWVS
jgi:DNA helicase-2/ATP-dependent DNA helicase PcrA